MVLVNSNPATIMTDTTIADKVYIEPVNDGTVEGLRHKKYPAFSVQFHPDATPGPHDEVSLFDDFMSMIDQRKEEERHA